ncbi:MAG: DUF4097 family beta strand repeat-containing protein [Candidatus Aminicenantes bacterium]|nr:DUF4097 family beta strand repeat-containing protein [Candidatus Aminicenantes bacterium]
MKKFTFAMLIILLAFSFLIAEDFEQKIVRTFELSANGSVELGNINGEIVVSTSGGAKVEIKAVKRSDVKGEIENVEVLFEQSGNDLRVKTKFNRDNTKAKVDFTVVIPEKLARAEFKSINGKLDCSGRFSDLLLKTVNGKIKFNGEFSVGTFKTVNGTIEISQEPLLNGDLEVETVNGGIAIELNGKSAFEIEGRTVNGSIENDFGLNVERHFVGSSFAGKVNGGGRKVKVQTVNGRIDISKI